LINIEQTRDRTRPRLSFMSDFPSIIAATRDGDDGLIVTFSDGTISGYVAEELLDLRPYRERTGLRADLSKTTGKLLEQQS
jgi:hypothetical protein